MGIERRVLEFGPISKLQLIKYAGASGDFNPIHTIEEKARESGLPDIIAHGMLTMGFMAQFFSSEIEKGAFLKDISARFTSKVFVGDTLTVQVKTDANTTLKPEKEQYIIEVTNQHDQLVAKGKTVIEFNSIKKTEENVK